MTDSVCPGCDNETEDAELALSCPVCETASGLCAECLAQHELGCAPSPVEDDDDLAIDPGPSSGEDELDHSIWDDWEKR